MNPVLSGQIVNIGCRVQLVKLCADGALENIRQISGCCSDFQCVNCFFGIRGEKLYFDFTAGQLFKGIKLRLQGIPNLSGGGVCDV